MSMKHESNPQSGSTRGLDLFRERASKLLYDISQI